MKLGTIVYDNKIYNLDYMDSEEIKNILQSIEKDKKERITEAKE